MNINNQIDSKSIVMVIDDNSDKLGKMEVSKAMKLAKSKGLDLCEVSPGVCKILDYGRLKYEQSKRDKKRKAQRQIEKTITIKPNIDENDLSIKRKMIDKFISDGIKVTIIVEHRGRQQDNIRDRISFIFNKLGYNSSINFIDDKKAQMIVG